MTEIPQETIDKGTFRLELKDDSGNLLIRSEGDFKELYTAVRNVNVLDTLKDVREGLMDVFNGPVVPMGVRPSVRRRIKMYFKEVWGLHD